MKQVFDKFDSNRDGKNSQEEYKATLKSLAMGGNMAREVFDISREALKMGGGIRRVDIESAFRLFDKNSDGKVTAEEVQDMLRRLGERCSLHDCTRMVRAVDTDGDGMVDMDEFLVLMTQSLTHG